MKLFCFGIALCFLGADVSAADGDWNASARADWFSLRETLSTGHTYVREDGLRIEGAKEYRRALSEQVEWRYRGSLYGTVVRHQGNDPTRFAIPNGTEDLTTVAQIGTRHQIGIWFPVTQAGGFRIGPEVGAAYDIWYRPLSYYEIWQVPSLNVAFQARKPDGDGVVSFELGVRRSVGAQVRTQTTRAPWSASTDTTLRLGDRANLYGSVGFKFWGSGVWGVTYEEQQFGASAVHVLNNRNSVFQPQTTIRTFGLSYQFQF